jgi:hypothetical protein
MTTAPAPIISVYDGSRLLGHIRERDRKHIALSWPDEILIGSYRTRTEAADAISAAHYSRQTTGGKR